MLNRSAGFSVLELLIGMVLGLIVMGGAIFLFSGVSLSAATLLGTNKMQQDVREIGLVMTRDIRRAGFSGVVPGLDFNGDGLPNAGQTDLNAKLNAIRTDILHNPYQASTADLAIYNAAGSNDCILFSYNVDADLPAANTAAAVENDEWFGYRRQVVNGLGVLQMKTAGASPANCNAGTWETISPGIFNVTALTFAMTTNRVEISNLSGGVEGTCEANDSCQCIRSVDVDMTVALSGDSTLGTVLSDSVRVRNDKVVPVWSGNVDCHD